VTLSTSEEEEEEEEEEAEEAGASPAERPGRDPTAEAGRTNPSALAPMSTSAPTETPVTLRIRTGMRVPAREEGKMASAVSPAVPPRGRGVPSARAGGHVKFYTGAASSLKATRADPPLIKPGRRMERSRSGSVTRTGGCVAFAPRPATSRRAPLPSPRKKEVTRVSIGREG
jgi:hypothetical protein